VFFIGFFPDGMFFDGLSFPSLALHHAIQEVVPYDSIILAENILAVRGKIPSETVCGFDFSDVIGMILICPAKV